MKWEYLTFHVTPHDNLSDTLNRQGMLGWELVAIHQWGMHSGHCLIFKRGEAPISAGVKR